MSTATTKLGLSIPDPSEVVDVLDDLGVQFGKIDTAMGVTWVADGGTPSMIYHGLHIKELTSEKEYIYKNDGVGGFIKVESHNPAWTDVGFQTNFTTQAGHPKPQYRVVNGMVQLRGAVRYTQGGAIGNIVLFINIPAPSVINVAGTVVAATYLRAICNPISDTTKLDGFVIINPRSDGIARIYNQGGAWAPSGSNMVYLDGLQYAG